ncbi:hypothetical protein BIV02_11700 [Curtobacterium sp. MMLR14_014]|nr:hypothetical protein BIU91_09705 [Curtobacterium sp. MMLR14_002]OII45627.1 hypothetical protein BIV02_11700 [Curtobacterium sp. MMLR14_014]
MRGIDISEEVLARNSLGLLETLLVDRATSGHIVWATDHYAYLGDEYAPEREITIASITGKNERLIQPRVAKAADVRWERTKDKAEVFTPSWLCNEQNNRVDDAWFGHPGAFNRSTEATWVLTEAKLPFTSSGAKTWKRYVDERRLEIACGEGPYLASRYDTTTGEMIALERRIGVLDRKLRAVKENASDDDEWRIWARRSVESVYGYEYHGDSLLLARENILATYADYAIDALGTEPSTSELEAIATVISWNLWQMDGLTNAPPFQYGLQGAPDELDIFGDLGARERTRCVLRDWRAKRTHDYLKLLRDGPGTK